MQAVRRVYLYVMSGITLAVISYGLVLLLRVLLDGLFPNPPYDDFDQSRQQLSQAIAMLGVGVPVWAVHWWLVQRSLRPGRPESDMERGAGARAVYITFVLLVTLVVWVTGGIQVLQWAVATGMNVSSEYYYADPLGGATIGVVGFVVWLYHGLVRRRDLAAGPVEGAAAAVPRLYLYGVSVGALWAVLTALDTIGSAALTRYPGEADPYQAPYLFGLGINGAAWALVWFGHWTYSNRLAREDSWRGTEERVSRTRLVALLAVIIAAAAMTLSRVAAAIGAALAPMLPAPPFLDPGLAPDPTSAILMPLLTAIPWAIVWFAHARALRREPAAADPLRALHQVRLESHGVSAAALAIGATGAGWLLGLVIDALLGGGRTSGPSPSTYELGQWLPATVVGLGAWGWFWRSVLARRRSEPVDEANSTIRRGFLFLTVGVALVAAIGTSALILYRLVGVVLDAGIGGNLASELSSPLGVLIAAGGVLAYHGLALRADQKLAKAAEPDEAAALAAASPVGSSQVERRAVVIVGPPADLDAALAAARAALPAGVEIVEG
jgi:hypothetical protein